MEANDRHPRRGGRRDEGDGAVRPVDRRGIWRPGSHHAGGVPRRDRDGAHDAGVPLHLRHQRGHWQPGAGDGRHARAEGRVAAAHRLGRDRHQLRADRTRCRQRFGQREDAGGKGWRRLSPDRHQALHHQCRQGAAVHRHGAHRRGWRARRLCFPRPQGPARHHAGRAGKEDGAEGRQGVRRQLRRRAGACRQPAGCRGRRVQDRDAGTRPRPAAHQRGVRRRRRTADRRLRRLCVRAQAVRPPDRAAPADPGACSPT